ncbi:Rpn family recombination-promoting nuclease/putative transposase [Cetobacterium sp. ZOR0034]|uniref:Rpn family recombination-promoting nuclease/putative transposase n=1 Tax=Cetobacterium sp. ZOR0034 TaxID=1339239 RepID=UPI00064721FC|nr:Rpn family recombination-promoting nuclease/putative transposase [Cetobacterium sp. ZOR0034]
MCTVLFKPKVDYIFKNLFGSEKHPKILISFLNACIKPESPIVSAQIKNSELTKEYIEDSFSRLDILAKTDKGEIINIEMQRADEKNMIKRSLYYWSKAFSGEYGGKSRYSELPRTVCVNVLDFNLLAEENYHNKYVLKNDKNNDVLTDVIELHFIELPKMKEIDPDDLLSVWTGFINDPNDEKIIELESRVVELHEAKIELARMSRDPKEAEYYRLRQNAMSERMNALLEAEDKGVVRGRAEGEKVAKLEIAKTALKNGLSFEIISGITGLSIEEIELLK